jgi:signal transduction histidine kinase
MQDGQTGRPPGQEQHLTNSNSDILSTIHEIRNSLCVISGFMEAILSRHRDNASARKEAETILREIEKCTNILNTFLSKRRKDTKRMRLAYLSEIVESVANSVSPLFAQKRVSLSWHAKGSLPPLLCEPEALESVILNLLKNSLDATEHSGKVKIEVFSSPSEQVLIVSDNGCGISEENLPHIFEPGFSTKPKGAGAGLSFCENVVKKHNGTISVESEEGAGTVVTVRFPLRAAPLREKQARESF